VNSPQLSPRMDLGEVFNHHAKGCDRCARVDPSRVSTLSMTCLQGAILAKAHLAYLASVKGESHETQN
jgi:hypothetical protein